MPADLTMLHERLLAMDVELLLVGGLAAVVQGAPISTFDWTSSTAEPKTTSTA
jgi:hypothetical protein